MRAREPGAPGAARARRCIVTRESLPEPRLIRFVLAPDGRVTPDLARKLPGRGLWLSARRDIVDRACAGNLFAKAGRRRAVVVDGLSDRIEGLLVGRCLELIGLARRAGQAVAGFEKARARLRRDGRALVVAAADGAPAGRAKMAALAPGRAVVDLLTAAELGSVFGRGAVVHAAVDGGRLAERLADEAGRLSGFRGSPDVGPPDVGRLD